MPLGQHFSAFDGEIEATRTALRLLNLHLNKFERAVIFSDSKAAKLSAGSTETVTSTETKDFQVLIPQLNLLKPNDIYICRTAALTSRRYILNIYSTNIHTEYFKHAA